MQIFEFGNRLDRTGLLGAALLALVALTGCASNAGRVEQNDHWPLEHGAWQLYESDGQLVYATDGRAARQVAEYVDEVRGDYREITGAEPIEVLPIAYASGDAPPIEEFESRWQEFLRGSQRHVERLRIFAATGEAPTEDTEASRSQKDQFEEMSQKEVPPEAIFAMFPIFASPGQLGPPPLIDRASVCVTLIPSSARRASAISEMISAGLRAEGIPLWKRVLMAPVMPFVRGHLEKMMERVCRHALFEVQLLSQEPRWSDEERREFLEAYAVKIGLHDKPDFSELKERGAAGGGSNRPERVAP